MFDWLFGSKSKTNYDDAMKQTQQASKAQADATAYFYDNIDGDKWNTLDDDSKANVLSQYNALNNAATSGAQMANQYNDTYNQELKDNRYNYFGDGLLGAILNPIGQTATGIGDLVTGQYAANDRDVASDLGAAAETALSFIPILGGASKALKLGKAGSTLAKAGDLMNSTKGMIATGGLFGGADALRQNGSETDLGDLLTGAGTGAAFSAAIPMGQRFLKNRGATNIVGKYLSDPANVVGSKAFIENGMIPQLQRQTISNPNLLGNYGGIYQNAIKSLIPKTTFGKTALGAGALYGGNKILSGFNQQPDYNSYSMMANGGY